MAETKFPVSQDRKTQNQVAAVLLLREIWRLENGEPSELQRRTAKALARGEQS